MRKNYMLLFALLLLAPAALFSINGYNANDKLYVHAPSGLVLRATADAKGSKVSTLDYGTEVVVLKENLRKKQHSVLEFKGYTLKGYWVKVRTPDNKEGYVFDGYLSRYLTPNKSDMEGEGEGTFVENYMARNTTAKGKRIDLPKAETRYERFKVLYKNGAEIEADMGEGGSSFSITFSKGTTLEEAYLIGKKMYLDEMVFNSTFAKGVITLVSEDETFFVEVKNQAGMIVLTMSHAD